ncbi:MAG: hypothetical protein V7631_2990 [Massilia sp.]|jgi:small-conductance mechanosensitive channel
MDFTILNNHLAAWGIALAIALAATVFLHTARGMVVGRLQAYAPTTATYLDDLAITILAATNPLFMLLMGVWAGSNWLALPDKTVILLSRLAIAVLLVQVARWGDVGVRGWLQHYRARRNGEDAASTTSTAALGFVARAAIWLIAILMILDNFGVNITTLVASLGIGGIAVALALQNILGDLFSSLSIVLDKPFVVGDFINVDDIFGTVEYVGLKTTRIRSLGGEQVVFSNSDLLKSRIRNYKRMETRRIAFAIRVPYGIGKAQLLAIPAILRAAVEAQRQVLFDRAHFKAYGLSSLEFQVVYFVQTADYGVYMDVQQAINLAIFDRFAEEGIEFAVPARSVHLSRPKQGADVNA